jgi:hypothetical protein
MPVPPSQAGQAFSSGTGGRKKVTMDTNKELVQLLGKSINLSDGKREIIDYQDGLLREATLNILELKCLLLHQVRFSFVLEICFVTNKRRSGIYLGESVKIISEHVFQCQLIGLGVTLGETEMSEIGRCGFRIVEESRMGNALTGDSRVFTSYILEKSFIPALHSH